MRKSRVFGILAVIFLVIAALTIVLPVASVIYGVYRSAGTVSGGFSTSTSGNYSIPTSFTLTNDGFLSLNGVYLNVQALSTGGVPLYHLTIGPEDIPPGSSAQFSIASTDITAFQQAFGNSTSGRLGGSIQLTAQVNLAGLIPISVTSSIMVQPSPAEGQ